MRVKDEIKESGYFWLPSAPQKQIPGTLSIIDGGKIELEIVGSFKGSIEESEAAFNNDENKFDKIIGQTERHGLVILKNCFYTDRKFSTHSGGISKSSLHVDIALLNSKADDSCAFGANEEMLINTFFFSVEGLAEWVGINGFEYNHSSSTSPSIVIKHTPPEEILLNLDNGMKLSVYFTRSVTYPFITDACISQRTYFRLKADQEYPLDDFIPIARKIVELLCFFIDMTVSIEHALINTENIFVDTGDEKSSPVEIQLFYESIPFSKEMPKLNRANMLIGFDQIQNKAEQVFNKWINAYGLFEPALNLYFSAREGAYSYLDSKFLALAQGLEVYDRRTNSKKRMDEGTFQELQSMLVEHCPKMHKEWLIQKIEHGNEISFSQRIKCIIKPFKKYLGTDKERKQLERDIVNTRNYLTHYDESCEDKAITNDKDLFSMYLKMEALFQLHFLQTLGLSFDEIDQIIIASRQLQYKLNYAPTKTIQADYQSSSKTPSQ